MMRNIKLTIEYDGTNYYGWQKQKNGPSIQEFIEKALSKVLREKAKLIGAARTDSGVHALGQVANFKTNSKLSLEKIQKALNNNLPKDITIVKVNEVGKDFNAQYSAKSKLYRYSIYNREERTPFFNRYSSYLPIEINTDTMKKATKRLIGRHDFSSFKGSKGVTKTQVRNIRDISIKKKDNHVIIDVEGDGFLYNMVRNIVGTLIEIGRGKLEPEDIVKILDSKDRTKAGPAAPAKGLTLVKVKY